MLRSLFALLIISLVGTSQGCRICDSPYDYCGPVMPCGEGCGHGGCGHGGYDGGYGDVGYGGGHGGCDTCGHGGGHAIEHSHEYEGGTVIEAESIPAPEMIPHQGRRPASKTNSNSVMKPTTKASYEKPTQAVRSQSAPMQAKPAKMSPYPASQTGNRMASGGKSDSNRGPIFW